MAGVMDQLIAGVSQLEAERGQSVTEGKSVRIVEFESNKRAVLNVREIQRIIKRDDLPTVVVSIGGVARSGKSFLLNLLINYLAYLEKHDRGSGWETSDQPVKGINWARGSDAVTLGIWMWNKQFVIKRSDGKMVAVLLVDSQGTGDNTRSDPKLDTLIMYISLQLSSFQLININSYLRAEELTSLQLCTDYADIDLGSPTGGQSTYRHLFNNLIFVIRNYQETEVFGELPNRFQKIKEKGMNEELSKAVEGIGKAFKHITTFTFPFPGIHIAVASEKQKKLTIQDIPKEFLDPVMELATFLFTSNRMAVKELPTGSQFLENFEVLKIRLESTDLPDIGNPADALQETILYQAFSKSRTLYTGSIEEVQRNLLSHKSEADLRKTLASARDQALQVFYSEGHKHKYGHSIIWSKYEDFFQTYCDDDRSVLIEKYNQEKKIADLEKHRQQLEEQAQKTTKQMETVMREFNVVMANSKVEIVELRAEMEKARKEDQESFEKKIKEREKSTEEEKEARIRAQDVTIDQLQQDLDTKTADTTEKKSQCNIL